MSVTSGTSSGGPSAPYYNRKKPGPRIITSPGHLARFHAGQMCHYQTCVAYIMPSILVRGNGSPSRASLFPRSSSFRLCCRPDRTRITCRRKPQESVKVKANTGSTALSYVCCVHCVRHYGRGGCLPGRSVAEETSWALEDATFCHTQDGLQAVQTSRDRLDI